MSQVEARLQASGFVVPEAAPPLAAYIPARTVAGVVYTAGQVPREDGQVMSPGKVGDSVSEEEARRATEVAVLQALSAVRSEVGDLDRVDAVIKLTVFVNSAPGFTNQPRVADAASEVLRTAFGDAGRHARSAIGVSELPLGSCVELELIVASSPH